MDRRPGRAVAGRIGTAQLDRLVAETIKRYDLAAADPAADPEDGYLSVDPRHVTVNKEDVHYAGTLHLEAELDIADALDLDRALAHGAALQKALGSTESLDVRRAKALGDLARTQTALDLFHQGEHRRATDQDGLPAAREVVVHAHFDATIVGEQTVFGPTGRIEEGQRLVLLDQIKPGAATPAPRSPSSPSSTSTPSCPRRRTRSPTGSANRSSSATAPACSRGAPDPPGAATSTTSSSTTTTPKQKADPNPGRPTTSNLAALCRYHHRLKTFTAWHYRMVEPGVFEWTSPHGHHYRRDRTGTTRARRTRATRPTMTPLHTPRLHGSRGCRDASGAAWTELARHR